MIIIPNEESKNITIQDGYLTTDKEIQKVIIQQLLDKYEWFRVRSLKSYLREWRAHNRLYRWGLFKTRTKDVDLNVHEYWWRRLGYFFLGF